MKAAFQGSFKSSLPSAGLDDVAVEIYAKLPKTRNIMMERCVLFPFNGHENSYSIFFLYYNVRIIILL